jgi:hypothetical protein
MLDALRSSWDVSALVFFWGSAITGFVLATTIYAKQLGRDSLRLTPLQLWTRATLALIGPWLLLSISLFLTFSFKDTNYEWIRALSAIVYLGLLLYSLKTPLRNMRRSRAGNVKNHD